jgi:uroporphyrinogen decarboxylase
MLGRSSNMATKGGQPMDEVVADGVHAMVPRDKMSEGARKVRDIYDIKPGAPFVKKEFGYFGLDRWYEEGLPRDADLDEFFGYDPPGIHSLGELGWTEAAFEPAWEELVVESRGDTEVFQDYAGRKKLCFTGRRRGFMPEYLDHPVKDEKTWEEDVKWRLDPKTPERFAYLDDRMARAKEDAAQGMLISQGLIGGCMYLRSLIGPMDVLYMYIEQPAVLHACMKAWFELADAVIAKHQEHVTLDQIFFAEDVCYKHGLLISPDMIREFYFPYYQQLITNLRRRQLDKSRKLFIQIDTDGNCVPAIPVYREIGMNAMSPFEVASGCDVVQIGSDEPDLVMLGGIDKRVLGTTREKIDQMLERILPPMRRRGGYTPTCDHGVPAEVSLENYLHYRKRCEEYGG